MAHRRFLYKKHTSHGDLNCKSFVLSHCLCYFTQKSLSAALRKEEGTQQNYLTYLCKHPMDGHVHAQYWQAKVPAYRGRVPSDNLHIVTIHYSPSLSTKSSFFLPSPRSLPLLSLLCCALSLSLLCLALLFAVYPSSHLVTVATLCICELCLFLLCWA